MLLIIPGVEEFSFSLSIVVFLNFGRMNTNDKNHEERERKNEEKKKGRRGDGG